MHELVVTPDPDGQIIQQLLVSDHGFPIVIETPFPV